MKKPGSKKKKSGGGRLSDVTDHGSPVADRGALTILQPDGWLRAVGYANGVAVEGRGGERSVFVAGQIGWDPRTGAFESDGFVAQVKQALENVVEVLRAAGAEPRNVVRMTWFVTDKAEYLAARREMGVAYRRIFDKHFPAMSVVFVTTLLEDRAKVEIEATAVVGAHERNAQQSLFGE